MHPTLRFLLLPTATVAVTYALTAKRNPDERPSRPQSPANSLTTFQVEPPAEDTPTYYFRPESSPRMHQERDVRGNERTASEIATALKAAGICGFDLEISVMRGVIILDGKVASLDHRVAAERLAGSVGEPRRVDNRLRIAAQGESSVRRLDD